MRKICRRLVSEVGIAHQCHPCETKSKKRESNSTALEILSVSAIPADLDLQDKVDINEGATGCNKMAILSSIPVVFELQTVQGQLVREHQSSSTQSGTLFEHCEPNKTTLQI